MDSKTKWSRGVGYVFFLLRKMKMMTEGQMQECTYTEDILVQTLAFHSIRLPHDLCYTSQLLSPPETPSFSK